MKKSFEADQLTNALIVVAEEELVETEEDLFVLLRLLEALTELLPNILPMIVELLLALLIRREGGVEDGECPVPSWIAER